MSEANVTSIGQWASRNGGNSSASSSKSSSAPVKENLIVNGQNIAKDKDSSSAVPTSDVGRFRASLNAARQIVSGKKAKALQEAVERASRLGTHKLYSLSWANMLDLFFLPIFYLWFHFWVKYIGSFKAFSEFSSPFPSSEIKDVLEKGEDGKTDYGWMLAFICLSAALIAVIFLVMVFLYILIKFNSMTLPQRIEMAVGAGVELATGGLGEAFAYCLEKLLE